MKRKLVSIITILVVNFSANSQGLLKLTDAQNYALEHNFGVKISENK